MVRTTTVYTEALALRSLSPIQLTATQQMILTGVGSGQPYSGVVGRPCSSIAGS